MLGIRFTAIERNAHMTRPGTRAQASNAASNAASQAETPARDRLGAALERIAAETEDLLDRLLAPAAVAGEHSRPRRLLDAMRHAALGGGKRFRPFLVVEAASLFGVERARALMAGAALECVHCYSLVHDDLPAMDDDSMRRGRPTVHKAFDEATAILAGDGLLTFAFDIASRPETHPDPAVRIELIAKLARAAGIGGMAGGQMLDLAAVGRFAGAPPAPDAAAVKQVQTMKTGALLQFACAAGGILGRAATAERAALDTFGAALGEAFQIADDLLDVHGDPALLGKATQKDAAAHKATFIAVLGLDGAQQRLGQLVAEAQAALTVFGDRADVLRAAAAFVAQRQS
jgi:farnesyl diphosphate synthase